MAETFESLLKTFRDVTHSKIKDNKDSAPVKLLVRTVKSLETVMTTLDKFLKSKNVDVGQAYQKSKDKAKSLAESGKKFMDEAKERGLRQTVTGKALDIKSKLGSIFSGDKEKQNGPPEDDESTEQAPSRIDKAKEKFNSLKDKLKDKLGGSKAPLEEKKSWLDRVKEKTANRKAEVEAEKKAVGAKAAKGKGGGWLGKILSGVMSLGGMVVGGLTKSINFLGGFLLKGFSKSLFRLVPLLSRGLAKGLQSVVGTGLAAAGKGAWGAVKMGARALLPAAGSTLGLVARGAAMIATGPIGWAVAAGTAIYAGYKLYKYLTRNNVAQDIYGKLTRLRLLMYGLNDVNQEYYSKIFDLEMVMKDYVKYNNYQVQITKLDSKAIEKVLEIFNVTREEKEKYSVLNNWFMKRFIPAYKAFVSALYSVNSNIYLDQIDKLKPGDLVSFMARFQIPTIIYNVMQVPTGDKVDVLVKKEDVDALYTNIANEVKAKAPKEKSLEEKAREENRQYAEKQKQAAQAAKSPTTAPAAGAALKKEQPVPNAKEASGPDAEGEGKPTVKEEMAKTQSKAAGKLNNATGSLMPGGMSLEGISTKLDKSKIFNLDPNVRELFTGMAKEYKALTGKDIPLNEAFRSYEDQAELYRKMPGKAAKPGNSTHEAGLAIDIASATSQELDKMGLLRKYGFTTAVGGEKWHLEPIGVSVNPGLAKKDEDFRTKAVLSSPGKGGGGYGFLDNSVLKKRDTQYQLSIYNSASDNPIDVEKVAEQTAVKPEASPTVSVNKAAPKSFDQSMDSAGKNFDKSLASAGAEVDKKMTPKIGDKFDKMVTPTAGDSFDKALASAGSGVDKKLSAEENYKLYSKSGGFSDSFTKTTVTGGGSKTTYADDGEPKPATTSSPFKKNSGPTLDVNNPKINSNMDLGKYAQLPTEVAIRQAAKMTNMDGDTLYNFAKIESSLNPYAQSKSSSAGGLFQITDGTWDGLMKQHAAKYNIPPDADKYNPFYNSLLAAEYSKDNLKRLSGWKQVGMEEPAALYLGHHFGVSGANKILSKAKQDEDAHISTAVSEASYKANRQELGNKSVGDYLDYLGQKIASVAGKIFKPKEYKGEKDEKKFASKGIDFGSTNVAASTPPAPQSPLPKAPVAPEPTPRPKMSMSGYASSMMGGNGLPKEPPPMQNSFKQMFDTSKMESVLGEQLTELRAMVGLLRSIDGKTGTAQSPAAKAATPPVDRSIPNSSINLSRKAIQT